VDSGKSIIELAKQAELYLDGENTRTEPHEYSQMCFERFAALVRAQTLEEAAIWFETEDNKHLFHAEMLWPHQVAERLRALKEQP